MGGLVSLRFLQRYPEIPWRGAVLSAPALGLRLQVPRWKRVAARVLSRGLPWLALDNGIDPADLSHDADVIEAYRHDPLVHSRISARLFVEMQDAAGIALTQMPVIAVPDLLLLLPLEDGICDTDASRAATSRIGTATNVAVRDYENAFHEVLNETCRERVVRDLLHWLENAV
jgi:alpha-beta hydrolase superfamily lysophospholipase